MCPFHFLGFVPLSGWLGEAEIENGRTTSPGGEGTEGRGRRGWQVIFAGDFWGGGTGWQVVFASDFFSLGMQVKLVSPTVRKTINSVSVAGIFAPG